MSIKDSKSKQKIIRGMICQNFIYIKTEKKGVKAHTHIT